MIADILTTTVMYVWEEFKCNSCSAQGTVVTVTHSVSSWPLKGNLNVPTLA